LLNEAVYKLQNQRQVHFKTFHIDFLEVKFMKKYANKANKIQIDDKQKGSGWGKRAPREPPGKLYRII
jgi:hypothetical protein